MKTEQIADAQDRAVLEAAGLEVQAVETLLVRARREVDAGLLPGVQIALARHGRVVLARSFGTAQDASLICIYSATKAITSACVWLLLQEGRLALDERVSSVIPEFARNGKEAVTVLHLLTHTAGFPSAPFRSLDWTDKARRGERYAQWRLNFAPGSRFEYHPTSTMWVLAELIERRTQMAFTDFVRMQLLQPLGIDDIHVGIEGAASSRTLDAVMVGELPSAEDYAKAGLPEPPVTEVTDDAILSFNRAEIRAVGVPGGGGFATASALALFYQALLSGGALPGRSQSALFSDATMAAARRIYTDQMRDPYLGCLANRGLGIVISGDEQRSMRGFGKQCSAQAFGHNGAGGQLAWADPVSGLSLCYLTNGHDRNPLRQARRGVAIGSLAAQCVAG